MAHQGEVVGVLASVVVGGNDRIFIEAAETPRNVSVKD